MANSPPLLIRNATARDLPELAHIEELAFEPPANRPWKAGEFTAELSTDRLFLVAESAPDLVGYTLFRLVAGEAELLRTAVRPRARRRGVARALLAAAFERLGETACILEVRADNHAAVSLYRAFDFAVEGRRRGYYPDGEDALLLRRAAA